MSDKATKNIIDRLTSSIADDTGNTHEDELDLINDGFNKTLADALRSFNSSAFDDDGFIKKMRDLNLDNKQDKELMKNVLNNLRSDYVNVETLNQSELLMRRDLENICTQMPEMRDVVMVIRDAIIECNVSTGDVSRSLVFENHEDDEGLESQVRDLEEKYDLSLAIKNFIVPKLLMHGENMVQVVPYAKLFAELESLHDNKYGKSVFHESVPNDIMDSFKCESNIYSKDNLDTLMESVAITTKVDNIDDKIIIDNLPNSVRTKCNEVDSVTKDSITDILKNISVYNGSSVLLAEMGEDGLEKFLYHEYANNKPNVSSDEKLNHFEETTSFNKINNGVFGNIDQDVVDTKKYSEIKGCYLKYLDGRKVVPIRMDRRVIGYYYVSTTMDLQANSANPNGMIDLSYQHYTRDKNLVDKLANMIIKSFDKQMLEKNIKLKNEIAEILMAHKFSEGKLSFIYIPENEVVRFVINEDENGKGHSVLEPTMFPARMYLMLTMYNMLYTLNNNVTRIHYLKSSGLDKDYASQIQRKMRKFQSRRITIDDIFSYSGVLNKVGGMGEMVLPAGRSDYKALETDTIEPIENPISMEFLESQRREAISGTGVPHLMMINAIDEADFAKTLEMANARFLSTVSSYKIDINKGLTKLYRILIRYCTDIEPDLIQTFRYMFSTIKQQELVITAEMISNFNSLVEMVESLYYSKKEVEDEHGNPTPKRMYLRRELAKEYLPQLDFDKLDEIIKRVDLLGTDDELQKIVNDTNIDEEDLSEVTPTK